MYIQCSRLSTIAHTGYQLTRLERRGVAGKNAVMGSMLLQVLKGRELDRQLLWDCLQNDPSILHSSGKVINCLPGSSVSMGQRCKGTNILVNVLDGCFSLRSRRLTNSDRMTGNYETCGCGTVSAVSSHVSDPGNSTYQYVDLRLRHQQRQLDDSPISKVLAAGSSCRWSNDNDLAVLLEQSLQRHQARTQTLIMRLSYTICAYLV